MTAAPATTTTSGPPPSAAPHRYPGNPSDYVVRADHIHWQCGKPHPYTVYSQFLTAERLADVQHAVALLEQATGLSFPFEGLDVDPDVTAPAPELDVGWYTSDAPELANSPEGIGWGQAIADLDKVHIGHAHVLLDAMYGNGATLLMHELGHAVGLEHSGPTQVMSPTPRGPAEWGAGDRAGLADVGCT